MMSENCFCGSALPYGQCCELVHSNLKNAETCEQLMRARYTAFVLQKIDFIYETFHPQTRRFQNKKEIEQWSRESNWQELNILKTTPSTVEFKAIYLDRNMVLQEHHEKSNFKKLQGIWYYVDGKLLA
ncbi:MULTISPECIES: YchJ family protein [Sphingobacterium]|uniref:YchJ family metal-binding protein n=1 Tax=Sphingobacterium tenebrionis TaxID=3111775 RepID=A0ABU8I7W4_9SPHI|nr:YchJ family metal-binding protein [Sphingobacterium sp. CZ-2]